MNIEPLEARIAPATLHVTSLLDDLSGGTLREAIIAANADPATADTIVFDPGVTGSIDLDPLKNAIPITGPVTIKGPGIDKLTVNGGNTTRAFFIDDGDAGLLSPVSISNLGIVGGAGGTNGGAIVCFEPLSLTNVGITGGQVNSSGGGLWVGTAGKVTLSGCRIFGNSADSGGGAAIAADAGITITKTIFAGNSAVDFDGGGALLASSGSAGFINITSSQVMNNMAKLQGGGLHLIVDATRLATVAKCVIAGNSSQEGGGAYLLNGRANVSNSFFTGNSAESGGGMFVGPAISDLALTKSVFSGNVATSAVSGSGGAIFVTATAKISGSQFLHNTSALDGGALGLIDAGVTISSSLFAGNTADADGGAIAQRNGSLVLKSGNFLANSSAVYGGAILADGAVTVTGGKFLHNTAGSNGGAIYTKRSSPSSAGALVVTGALFQGNVGDGGGALFFFDDSTGTIKGAKFLENLSKNTGGAVSSASTGTIDLSGSLFRGNVADTSGGAVRIILGDARITSCSFFDNTGSMKTGEGGAISIKAGAGVVTLSKLKVIGNSAATGGGISNAGGATSLTASTVIGNFAIIESNTSGI